MADKGESEPPLLFISSWGHKEKKLIYSATENRFRSVNVDVLLGKEIKGSSYGWLVLVNNNIECCLFNPVSMDIIKLPSLKTLPIHRCILSKPPTEPDCHILFSSYDNVIQNFCKIGDLEFVEWITHKIRAIGSFQGKIYGVVDNNEIVTIHFVNKTLEFRPVLGSRPWSIPQLSPPWISEEEFNLMWLIESPPVGGGGGTELLLVQKTYSCRELEHGVEFRVFEIDMKKMKIVELESIGDRTIFIACFGTLFCRSSCVGGLKANSIYYTEPHGRILHVFDLEDRSTISMLPSSAAVSFNCHTSWVDHSSCHKLLMDSQ